MELQYNKHHHFQFSPPVQLLFHEQAKSIIALQELQSEVSHLLEFKNILLESYPHLQDKIKSRSNKNTTSSSASSSWSNPEEALDESTTSSDRIKHAYTTNISDSGFGNSADLKESMNLLLNQAGNKSHFIVDHDELLLLLDVIHEKSMIRMNSESLLKTNSAATLCNSSTQHSQILCSEIESLKREKDSLLSKIVQLESQVKDKDAAKSNVHSVQIRTSEQQEKKKNSVNIEIKGPISKQGKNTKDNVKLKDVNVFASSKFDVSRKIGKTDKLDLSELAPLQAIILLRGNESNNCKKQKNNLSSRVTREKIRKILNINNVIELQRQLLATVMEKEVYKSHLEKLCEAWNRKIKEFEHQNESLQASLSNLKSENESLKSQVLYKRKHLNTKSRNPSSFVSLSWNEANNGIDEILSTQHHIVSPSGSVPFHHQHHIQPDSLLEDEATIERQLKPKNDELFYDSISILESKLNKQEKEDDERSRMRKLIIPYNESFNYNSIVNSSEDVRKQQPLRREEVETEDSDISANASSSESSSGLSKMPITEKLKKKILGW